MPRSVTQLEAGMRGLNMNFDHEELMLMMLHNTGTRLGLIHELRLMQCYLCLLYTSPSPRDGATSRMPSSA